MHLRTTAAKLSEGDKISIPSAMGSVGYRDWIGPGSAIRSGTGPAKRLSFNRTSPAHFRPARKKRCIRMRG